MTKWLQRAAQIWCRPGLTNREMDAHMATAFAEEMAKVERETLERAAKICDDRASRTLMTAAYNALREASAYIRAAAIQDSSAISTQLAPGANQGTNEASRVSPADCEHYALLVTDGPCPKCGAGSAPTQTEVQGPPGPDRRWKLACEQALGREFNTPPPGK